VFEIEELSKATWPDFVRVMEKHNGVWNGCWCVTFHLARGQVPQSIQARRDLKEELVKSDRSHAALVYEGADIVGWCQFGAPSELPARMGGFTRLGATAPDWRITCFFVDRDHRRQGVAEAALTGALCMIAAQGGGTVDAYPIATRSRPYSSSFLWGGTQSMFEDAGFRVLGSLGTSKLVMRKNVRARKSA
jgi:GNAT superfamily N-acetyltransferase